METLLAWCLEHINYWTITILMILENSFIPLPSELIVTPAAYKAANGELNILLVLFFTTLGALTGALINYYLAQKIGRPLVFRFANSRIGQLCLLDRQKIEQAEAYFIKYGKLSTFIGRLIPAVRQFISIPAGLAHMDLRSFILYTSLGAALWNGILVLSGYYLAQVIPEEQLIAQVKHYSLEIGSVFILVGIIFISYLWLKYKLSKHKS